MTCAIAAALSITAVPAAAQTVVVRSTGPSAAIYPAGRRLNDGQTIVLRTGDRVVLLRAGGTRTLSGPGRFPATGPPVSTATRQQTALRYAAALARADRRSNIGGVRRERPVPTEVAAEMAIMPVVEELWSYRLGMRGTVCVPDLHAIVIVRSDSRAAATITIRQMLSPGNGAIAALPPAQSVTMNARIDAAYWPAVAPVEGAEYQISARAGIIAQSLTRPVRFAVIAVPSEFAALAALFAERGCTEQLDRLTTMMPPDAG